MAEAERRDGVPVTAGWFVVNVRGAPWEHNSMRAVCKFGGEGDAHFDDLGIGLYFIQPGKPMSLYHHEAGQEDFLILSGRCTVLIDGQRRDAGPWDFALPVPHGAHDRRHGRGAGADLGGRRSQGEGQARYPVEPEAIRLGAGVPDEHTTADQVFASFGEPQRGPAPDLPDWAASAHATSSEMSRSRSASEANR